MHEPWGEACATSPVEIRSPGPGLQLFEPRPHTSALSAVQMLRLQEKLRDLIALHDFTGALQVAEAILASAPGYAPALQAQSLSRSHLQQMYASRLGDLRGVPQLQVGPEEIHWLNLDQRAGFVLSQVDGTSTYEEIQDISGLPSLETLKILSKLVADGVIASPKRQNCA